MGYSKPYFPARMAILGAGAAILAGCAGPMDVDLRGGLGAFSTAEAAAGATTAARPVPDTRGVISYPTYQVAVAERGDTLNTVATRLGVDAGELARFNGISPNTPLRGGEVIALPERVAPGAPAPGSSVDIGAIAGSAINRAPAAQMSGGTVRTAALPPAAPEQKNEPVRHRVERGETAYTIARLYQVPVKSLAEWNGLGSDLSVREGQYLLVPVAQGQPPAAAEVPVTPPGNGTPTPTPPSAAKPLPETPPAPAAAPAAVDVGEPTTPPAETAMVFPVEGSIIREYAKGKNEGIDIKGAAGTSVKAADDGTVAAITKSGAGIPIIVVRHDTELLTVYANVTDVSVEKGARVSRGQGIAKLRGGDDAYVHFEVRQGFDSVDPLPYLR